MRGGWQETSFRTNETDSSRKTSSAYLSLWPDVPLAGDILATFHQRFFQDPRDLIRDAVAGGGLPSDLLDKDAMARTLLSGLPQFPALEAFHRQREMLNSPHNFLSAAAAAGLRTPPSLVNERTSEQTNMGDPFFKLAHC